MTTRQLHICKIETAQTMYRRMGYLKRLSSSLVRSLSLPVPVHSDKSAKNPAFYMGYTNIVRRMKLPNFGLREPGATTWWLYAPEVAIYLARNRKMGICAFRYAAMYGDERVAELIEPDEYSLGFLSVLYDCIKHENYHIARICLGKADLYPDPNQLTYDVIKIGCRELFHALPRPNTENSIGKAIAATIRFDDINSLIGLVEIWNIDFKLVDRRLDATPYTTESLKEKWYEYTLDNT